MKRSLGYWMLLSLASISYATSVPEHGVQYGFATKDYSIEMKITFLDPYVGQRLAFSSGVDPGKELCISADDGRTGPCIERFVGSVAVVRYSVKLATGVTPSRASIGERVTVSAQSSGLPRTAPFSMTQQLVEGIGSEL